MKIPSKYQEQRLFALMRLTLDAIVKAHDKELRKHGISVIETSVLFVTNMIGDKATPADISRWMFREHHTVTSLLGRMEKKGLIKTTKDLERKNMMRVSMTDKGKQVYRISRRVKVLHRIHSGLSKQQRQQLISNLNILRTQALKELNIDYKPPFP